MMNDIIEMVEFVKSLASRPRGRACIVLTHGYDGQKEWAAELARQTDSEHIDLLELFAADETLSGNISQFSVPKLFEFLKDKCRKPVLIVSGIEFLKATWSGRASAVEEFATKVEFWDKKNAPGLLFVLQHDSALASRPFLRFKQHTFVVNQKETLAL
ncbi:MAG: hypothetical protein JRI94_13395 [Deltaproteobacteria bacterium]|nr:hypothetical protein [Deltaproteobacteria bacterium]